MENIKKYQTTLVNTLINYDSNKAHLIQMFYIIKQISKNYKLVHEQIDIIVARNKDLPVINPMDLKYWCKGYQYYEEPGSGDGFTAIFFNNEFF